MMSFTMRPRPGVVFQTQTARTIETIVRRSAPRNMGLSSPWGSLPNANSQDDWDNRPTLSTT